MKRALKWMIVAVVIAEWYTRGGREFLFGDAFTREDEGLTTIRTWVDLPEPPRVVGPEGVPILSPAGETVGAVREVRMVPSPFGGRMEALVEIERAKLGYPINVALSQAREWTMTSLDIK